MTSKQTSFIYRNGLSLVLLALFAVSWPGRYGPGCAHSMKNGPTRVQPR